MHEGKLVFAQVMDRLPMHTFRRCVERYDGNKAVKSFSCSDQFRCMAFAQLTWRESLRDMTDNERPSNGCRSRVIVADAERSWRWVVCGVFLRPGQSIGKPHLQQGGLKWGTDWQRGVKSVLPLMGTSK